MPGSDTAKIPGDFFADSLQLSQRHHHYLPEPGSEPDWFSILERQKVTRCVRGTSTGILARRQGARNKALQEWIFSLAFRETYPGGFRCGLLRRGPPCTPDPWAKRPAKPLWSQKRGLRGVAFALECPSRKAFCSRKRRKKEPADPDPKGLLGASQFHSEKVPAPTVPGGHRRQTGENQIPLAECEARGTPCKKIRLGKSQPG